MTSWRSFFSSAGAQDKESSGFEPPDLDDIEIFWEKPQLKVYIAFRHGIRIIFSSTAIEKPEMERSVRKKPHSTRQWTGQTEFATHNSISGGPNRPSALLLNSPSATRNQNVSGYL